MQSQSHSTVYRNLYTQVKVENITLHILLALCPGVANTRIIGLSASSYLAKKLTEARQAFQEESDQVFHF